jgi:S1-C subfamily serine protease
VDRGSDGDAKELRRGDFLEAVNGQPISDVSELTRILSQAGGVAILTLKRYSGGQRVFTYLERQIRVDGVESVAGRSLQGVAVAPAASRLN